jgi:hypothetical protein
MSERDSRKLGHYIAHVVSIAGALTAVYQCSEARAKVAGLDAEVEKSKAETEQLRQQISSAPAQRTIQVAQELAKYPDAADKALVLRAIAKLDPDPTVRAWAQSELDRLRPELEQLQKEASQVLVATTEQKPAPVSTSGSGVPSASSAPAAASASPMMRYALKDTRTLAFDATLKRATRIDSLLADTKAAPAKKCASGSVKGALAESDSATCRKSVDGAGVPQGADEVHPSSGNGMLYWRMKSPAGFVHCQCQEG